MRLSCLLLQDWEDMMIFRMLLLLMYVTQSTEKNMVIVLGADDEPHFCKIVRCLVITSEMVYFVCQNLQVKYYDSHLHAYAVEQGEGLHAVDHHCLNYYRPLSIRRMFDSTCEYVAFT